LGKDREVEDVPSIFIRLFFTPEQDLLLVKTAFCSNIKLRLKRLDEEGVGSRKKPENSLIPAKSALTVSGFVG